MLARVRLIDAISNEVSTMKLADLLRLSPEEALARGGVKVPNPKKPKREDDDVYKNQWAVYNRILEEFGLDMVLSPRSRPYQLESEIAETLASLTGRLTKDQHRMRERLLTLLAAIPNDRRRSYRGVTVREADVVLTIKVGQKERHVSFPRSMIDDLPRSQ